MEEFPDVDTVASDAGDQTHDASSTKTSIAGSSVQTSSTKNQACNICGSPDMPKGKNKQCKLNRKTLAAIIRWLKREAEKSGDATAFNEFHEFQELQELIQPSYG